MRKSRFTEAQIVAVLDRHAAPLRDRRLRGADRKSTDDDFPQSFCATVDTGHRARVRGNCREHEHRGVVLQDHR